MLPSPVVDLGDDHEQLYDAARWGDVPVKQPLLARAERFMRDLDVVLDPERLVYVAGFNRSTPARIRVGPDGRFSYRRTLDGDGRVPHELGLLEEVTTYWVDETHGALAKNGQVLDAITELLQTGRTNVLSATKPSQPDTRAVAGEWVAGDSVEPLPAEARVIAEKAKVRRRATGEPALTPEEEAELRTLTLSEYLGAGIAPACRSGASVRRSRSPSRAVAPRPGPR